jgi:hypothetical protein
VRSPSASSICCPSLLFHGTGKCHGQPGSCCFLFRASAAHAGPENPSTIPGNTPEPDRKVVFLDAEACGVSPGFQFHSSRVRGLRLRHKLPDPARPAGRSPSLVRDLRVMKRAAT